MVKVLQLKNILFNFCSLWINKINACSTPNIAAMLCYGVCHPTNNASASECHFCNPLLLYAIGIRGKLTKWATLLALNGSIHITFLFVHMATVNFGPPPLHMHDFIWTLCVTVCSDIISFSCYCLYAVLYGLYVVWYIACICTKSYMCLLISIKFIFFICFSVTYRSMTA